MVKVSSLTHSLLKSNVNSNVKNFEFVKCLIIQQKLIETTHKDESENFVDVIRLS